MSITLGLDLGANSIGWALLDIPATIEIDNEDSDINIIDMGVRIFDEGVENLGKGESEQSKNATRRDKRQIRKMLCRRRRRLNGLMKVLELYKLKSLDMEEFQLLEPYECRANAANGKVSLDEFSRALYHICHRRGFLSNRKTAKTEDTGAIFKGVKGGATGITELQQNLENGNFKTLGEYFYQLDTKEQRIRNRYTLRKMYLDEFNYIWEKQKEFYQQILTDELLTIIRDRIIFKQRPLKSVKHLVGKCKFEKNKKRAPKSSFEFQEFRMLQQVNNLRISGGSRIDEETQQLTLVEREKLINELSEKGSVKLDDKKTRTLLGLDPKIQYKFNLEHQGKLDGLYTLYEFKKALGNCFKCFNQEDLNAMLHSLYYADSDEWLKEYAKRKWNLSEEIAVNFTKIKLQSDYGTISTKAIRKILPYMREGLMYDEAAKKAGYDHSLYTEEIIHMEKLPEPDWFPNPIVRTTLYELKKVVNAIIDRYGNPEVIKLELAGELKIPKSQRNDISINNRKIEAKKKEIIEILKKELNISHPSKNDIIKYRLWEESKKVCVYTGKSIEVHELYGEAPVYEIEHIIPYSRSLDDSFGNKSLCHREENRRKGNKTPFELYSNDPEKYAGVKDRAKELPVKKAMRFIQKELDDGFIDRKLNDTRYASKVAQNWLRHLTPDVQVSQGSVTAFLRRQWGLNGVYKNDFLENDIAKRGEKNRKDHRHHAIDAVTIALTTRSHIQKLATESARDKFIFVGDEYIRDEREIRIIIPSPSKNLRVKVVDHSKNIIVSHKCKKRVSGAIHAETLYGQIFDNNGMPKKSQTNADIFAVRKPLEVLTGLEIMSIADKTIRDIILERIYSLGGKKDSKGKLANIPKNWFIEPLYLPSPRKDNPNPIKKVRVLKAFSNAIKIHDYNIWAESGTNHHAIIYIDGDGKPQIKLVSMYEAYQRKRAKLPIVDKELNNDEEFVFSMMRNEMFTLEDFTPNFDFDDKSLYRIIFPNIYRLQKMSWISTSKYVEYRHHSVSVITSEDKQKNKYNPGLNRICTVNDILKIKKIIVDPIGFVRLADE